LRGYSFQSSLVCELIRRGAKPIEVPIIFKDRVAGQSKLTLKDQVEFLVNITKITYQYSEYFIRYCCVGIIGTLVNLGVYLLLNKYFQIPLQVASLMALETSIVSNFLLNNFWTFKARSKKLSVFRRLVNFHIAAGISGILFYYLFFLLLTIVLGINGIYCEVGKSASSDGQ
jgi:dolichol-phosphate mannosyltransferase